ncbi:MAG: Gfo/Idh/MocA family oxidoreductase [Chloroflexi bacterium]|nr:Gfo/Idh/MocA family oxidoreductase [Chloroflexota bacterium]
MTEPLKVIHVGVGGRGAWPVRLFREEREHWRSVALVDVNPEALAAARHVADLPREVCYDSLEAALAGHAEAADGVVVITPSALHGRFIRQALEAGKHVLVEKPFVHHLSEAEALVELAEARDLRLVVAQNYRWNPAQQTLRRLLAEAAYGPASYATFVHHRYRPEPRAFTMPHSMLIEMSVHHFDDFRCIFGREPKAITARSFNPAWSRYLGAAAVQALLEWDLPGSPAFTLAYTGTFTSASNQLGCRIECERGALLWDEQGVGVIPTGERERQPLPLPQPTRRGEQHVADAWFRSIRHGEEPEISGRQNLGTLRMIDAAIRSSETGTRIVLS